MDKIEEKRLVGLLVKLEPGFLPYDIFVQLARLVVLPIVEFVPVRMSGDQVEVLLLERSKYDDIWPGEVHTPGTVVRPTDTKNGMFQAFKRISEDELGGLQITEPYFVGSILHESRRGMEYAQVYWVEILEEPKKGQFYAADKLPDNLIGSQKQFIDQAVRSYKTCKA